MKVNYNLEGVFSKVYESTVDNVTVDSMPFEYNFSKSSNFDVEVSSILKMEKSEIREVELHDIKKIRYIFIDVLEGENDDYHLQFSIDDGATYIDFEKFMIFMTVGVDELKLKNPNDNTISLYISAAGDA